MYINETDGVYYKFVPKTTGYYSVEGGFYDEEWNQIYSEEMLAGNAYYLARMEDIGVLNSLNIRRVIRGVLVEKYRSK